MGHGGSLVHVSAPRTVHNPTRSWREGLEICSCLCRTSVAAATAAAAGVFLALEAVLLSDAESLYLT